MAGDPHDLARFVAAQSPIYADALGEVTAGRKRSHWMWFVFPQLAGLGHSAMAQRYAIGSLSEAEAYLAHPILGARYRECLAALAQVRGTAAEVFGSVDAMKLRSSLTLFEVAGAGIMTQHLLDRWFAGVRDPATLALLSR